VEVGGTFMLRERSTLTPWLTFDQNAACTGSSSIRQGMWGICDFRSARSGPPLTFSIASSFIAG
jgi:hypothetical protein